MDTPPIGYNPHISPVSGPTGPQRIPGSRQRSVDSSHAKPWQTSVPLLARGAPSALDLSALRDLTKHLAEADEGFATPMTLLAAKVEESSNQKLLQNFSAYRQDLFNILTPEALRATPEYLDAYRKFLGRYRDCSLCSVVTLKNSQGLEAKIDKLLICAASSVIEYAFETGWAECKIGIYLSDELNEDFFSHVVDFIKTGTFSAEQEQLLDSIIARYTAALALDMQAVIRYCQTVLSAWSLPVDKMAFYTLWRLGYYNKEGFLKCFCLSFITSSPNEEILQSRPEELHKVQDDYARLYPSIVLHPSGVKITQLNDDVMQLCQELNLKEVQISGPVGTDLKDNASLKQFKKITLYEENLLSEVLAGNQQLTELICLFDIKAAMAANIIAENSTLKSLYFRSIKMTSEEELHRLGAALQQNQTLSFLQGISQAYTQWLTNVLIAGGPYERPVVIKFSSF